MRSLFTVAFLLFVAQAGFGQESAEFQWSEHQNRRLVGQQNPTLVFPTTDGYTVYSVEKIGTQFYAPNIIYVSKYDSTGQPVSTIDFKLPQRSRKDATLIKVLKGNNKLYFFSNVAVKKDGKNVLYAQVYDNDTNQISEAKEIFTIPIEKVNNSGFFEINISQDDSKLGVLVNLPFAKKTKESIVVIALDENLNQISTSSHALSFESKRAYNETFFCLNNGSSVIIKKTDISKKKPVTTAILISGDDLNEHQISAEGFYISDSKVITINGSSYLLGFATDNAKPAVSVGGAKDNSYFIYNISEAKLIKHNEWSKETIKKVLGKGYIDLKVKDILVQNNDIFLIGDRYSKVSEAIEGKNFEYNYTHRFGAGVVIKMNVNGDIIYETPINYGEEYLNEMKVLGSFYPFLLNEKLYLLANEKESILKDKKIVMGYDKINATAIVLKSIDDHGNITVLPFWNSKTGGAKMYSKFAPTQTLMLSDNTFFIYAIGNDMHKFGKMTLK